jgi:hypothetical protein
MLRKFFRKIGPRKGQSILEFAMIIPLLLVLFMGVFDFGWVMHRQVTIDNAAREAARRGAVGLDTPAMVQLVKDSVYFPVTDDQITVSVMDEYGIDTGQPDNRTPDNHIVVEVSLRDVQLMTPLKNLVDAIGTINLSSRAEFLIE